MKNNIINIEINYPDLPDHIKQSIHLAASKALSTLVEEKQVELTVLICDDDYMQELNFTYRGQDKTTDVLSFEDRFEIPDTEITYMGDIAISYPTATKQSLSFGHNLVAEISLLTIHGVLHLFGYDHQDQPKKSEMWAIQSKILASLGFSKIDNLMDDFDA